MLYNKNRIENDVDDVIRKEQEKTPRINKQNETVNQEIKDIKSILDQKIKEYDTKINECNCFLSYIIIVANKINPIEALITKGDNRANATITQSNVKQSQNAKNDLNKSQEKNKNLSIQQQSKFQPQVNNMLSPKPVTSLKKHSIADTFKDQISRRSNSINIIQKKQEVSNNTSHDDSMIQNKAPLRSEKKKLSTMYPTTNNLFTPKTNLPSIQSNNVSQSQSQVNIAQLEQTFNSKIDNLTAATSKSNSQIQKLQSLINSLNFSITSTQKSLSAQKEQFIKYVEKNNVEIVKKKLTELEFQFSNLEDIDEYKTSITSLKSRFNDISTSQNEVNEALQLNQNNISQNQKKIDEIGSMVSSIRAQISSMQSTYSALLNHPVDYSKYLQVNTFSEFKKNCDALMSKALSDLDTIKASMNTMNIVINTKAHTSDLTSLKDFLLSKLEELGLACNRKFADQIETIKSIKMIEQNIKSINKEISKRDKGDNWLLAKKPLNGHMCASCEAYLGNLKENSEFVPWNKYPMREPTDKYKSGVGYSKMLQMMNGGVPIENKEILKQSMSCSSRMFPRMKMEKRNDNSGLSEELNEQINIESAEENNDHNSGPECVVENNENDPKITKIYKIAKNVD